MTTIIKPTDFGTDRWTVGTLTHLIAALAGSKVIIEIDSGTGHAVTGVLVETYYGGPTRGQRVVVKTEHRGTAYNLLTVGNIVALDNDRAKWAAMDTLRKANSAAITTAQALHGDTHQWGKWEATPLDGGDTLVTYTPLTGNPAFADRWGTRDSWTIPAAG